MCSSWATLLSSMGDEAPNLADLKLCGGGERKGQGKKVIGKKKKRNTITGVITHGKRIYFHPVMLITTPDVNSHLSTIPWWIIKKHSQYNSVFEETESTSFTSFFPETIS